MKLYETHITDHLGIVVGVYNMGFEDKAVIVSQQLNLRSLLLVDVSLAFLHKAVLTVLDYPYIEARIHIIG